MTSSSTDNFPNETNQQKKVRVVFTLMTGGQCSHSTDVSKKVNGRADDTRPIPSFSRFTARGTCVDNRARVAGDCLAEMYQRRVRGSVGDDDDYQFSILLWRQSHTKVTHTQYTHTCVYTYVYTPAMSNQANQRRRYIYS